MGRWVSGKWSVGRLVGGRGSVVGGFNKTRLKLIQESCIMKTKNDAKIEE